VCPMDSNTVLLVQDFAHDPDLPPFLVGLRKWPEEGFFELA
jgi:hypothetical protein